jgi:cytokinin dehydrogenase
MQNRRFAQPKFPRRSFTQAVASGSLMMGIDAAAGPRVASAESPGEHMFEAGSRLGPALHTDRDTRERYARDYGQIVHALPQAVLMPRSIEDLVELVQLARRHEQRVAVRGAGHQPFGQAQVRDGIVIDMRSLSSVRAVVRDSIDIEAGALWRSVVRSAAPQGLQPPVVPNFLGLTVGGTLSVGGVGMATLHYGAQVDRVRALEVVTGEAELVTCSPTERRDLFEAVLAGQGQCGIIVRAELELVRRKPQLREYMLEYDSLEPLLADLRELGRAERFDGVVGLVAATGQGWSYMLQAVRHFGSPDAPDDAKQLAGLHHRAGAERTRELSYVEHADAHPVFDAELSHADLGLMVPGSALASFLGGALPRLTGADLGEAKAMRVFAWPRRVFQRPLFCVPEDEICAYVALLRAESADPAVVDRMLAGNRALFEQNRALGGKLYPFSALALSRRERRANYGEAWSALQKAKQRYDPDGVFATLV